MFKHLLRPFFVLMLPIVLGMVIGRANATNQANVVFTSPPNSGVVLAEMDELWNQAKKLEY